MTFALSSPILHLFSFLYPKNKVPVSTRVGYEGRGSKYEGRASKYEGRASKYEITTPIMQVTVQVGESTETQIYPSPSHTESPPPATPTATPTDSSGTIAVGDRSYRLEELAFLRSGDKGNSCNIGECNLRRVFGSHEYGGILES